MATKPKPKTKSRTINKPTKVAPVKAKSPVKSKTKSDHEKLIDLGFEYVHPGAYIFKDHSSYASPEELLSVLKKEGFNLIPSQQPFLGQKEAPKKEHKDQPVLVRSILGQTSTTSDNTASAKIYDQHQKDFGGLGKYNEKGDAAHYEDRIDVITQLERTRGTYETMVFCEMNAIKYRMRMGKKAGETLEKELTKANWYEAKARELRAKIATPNEIVWERAY